MSAAVVGRSFDRAEIVRQIGRGNVLAISGGRVRATACGISLPVRYGYTVEVDYRDDDTYTVRRVFTRAGTRWVKGERERVYCTEVGEAAYRASCYTDGEDFR